MIPAETVDRIYSVAKIEEVVGEYVSLKRRGVNFVGLCPFPGHNEKTPSFTVNPARNICKCFGCGRGGNAVNFVMEMEQCSYPDALRKIAKKYNIEIEERELTAEEQQRQDDRESMFVVNEWANSWFQRQLWETEEGQTVALAYFRERGLRDETIHRFQLGFSPEYGNKMTEDAKKEGFKEQYLCNNPDTRIGTGICGRAGGEDGKPVRIYDRYHGRVIFPIHTVSGKTVGFAGRIMVKKDNVGKYVNSPESVIYSKTRELYGLFLAKQAIIKQQKCYLVEGQMDVISMSQAGIENVVCSGGTALTREQIRSIHKFTDNVTILYDGDAAGVHAALRGIDMFLDEGMYIKVMLFPDGDDPDSFARKHTSDEFVQYINIHEEDFIHYKARTLLADAGSDAGRRSEAIQSIFESVASVKNKVARDIYTRDAADLCGIAEQTVRVEIAGIRSRMTKQWWDEKNKNGVAGNQQTGSNRQIGSSAVQMTVANTGQAAESTVSRNMRHVMSLIITMGMDNLEFDAGGGMPMYVTAGAYIQQYITATRIPITEPLYNRILEEFNAHCGEENFNTEHFFLNHHNPELSALAADIVSSEEVPEKNEQTQHVINSEVLNALYDLHFSVVTERLSIYPAMIKAATDGNEVARLLAEQQQLNELRRQIADMRHRIN